MTKLYFYKAHQNTYPIPKLPDVKIVSNHFGYSNEPPYKDIEKYDLNVRELIGTFDNKKEQQEAYYRYMNSLGF